MLRIGITHPELLAGLARCGHGDQVLVTDGNYPAITKAPPEAIRIHLNLVPGIVTARSVLEAVQPALPVQATTVMLGPGTSAPLASDIRSLWPDVDISSLDPEAFYAAASAACTTLVIVTGDVTPAANALLTVGVHFGRQSAGTSRAG